jgi:hypothetical protein
MKPHAFRNSIGLALLIVLTSQNLRAQFLLDSLPKPQRYEFVKAKINPRSWVEGTILAERSNGIVIAGKHYKWPSGVIVQDTLFYRDSITSEIVFYGPQLKGDPGKKVFFAVIGMGCGIAVGAALSGPPSSQLVVNAAAGALIGAFLGALPWYFIGHHRETEDVRAPFIDEDYHVFVRSSSRYRDVEPEWLRKIK